MPGIRIVMLSGDARKTAESVGKQLTSTKSSPVLPGRRWRRSRRFRASPWSRWPVTASTLVGAAQATSASPWYWHRRRHRERWRHPGERRPARHRQGDPPVARHHAQCQAEPVLRLFYNAIGVPIAANVLYPFFGLLLSPIFMRRGDGDELQCPS
jgi:hypothetical protein